jgi:hypothetical protein
MVEAVPVGRDVETQTRIRFPLARGYELSDVDQLQVEVEPDVLPAAVAVRARLVRSLAA